LLHQKDGPGRFVLIRTVSNAIRGEISADHASQAQRSPAFAGDRPFLAREMHCHGATHASRSIEHRNADPDTS
jgi:hypothetical protein